MRIIVDGPNNVGKSTFISTMNKYLNLEEVKCSDHSKISRDYFIDLLNRNNTTTTKPVTTTTSTTTTSEVINNTILTCKYRNYSYEYTFDKDNKLIKIFNSYSFNSEDKTVYEDTLNTYISRSKDINNMGGNSKVINDDENNTFVFENIIDKEIDLSSIDVNYFVLSSNYNDVLNQLSGKGFDCK